MTVTIYHNPACGTSRNTLAIIRATGLEPIIIEYLKTPPSRADLRDLVQRMGVPLRDVLRRKGTPFDKLGLGDPSLSDEALLDAVDAHPILIDRPIVVTEKGVRLCRPSEIVLEMLDRSLLTDFAKEDGAIVVVRPGVSDDTIAAMPALDLAHFRVPDPVHLTGPVSRHQPRILLLHGSLRARSYSRFLADEAERVLLAMGCETRRYDPAGLPLPDGTDPLHPKVQELRALSLWSEGQVWSSPERHGTLSGIMKVMIDWLPLSEGGLRPTQGRTLAVMQVSGGSQSFNAVNAMRLLGRWMRMITIPNQSSVPKAFELFDQAGRLPSSSHYERLVDVCEELVRFTWLVRDNADALGDRYSERIERAGKEAAAASSIAQARSG